MNVILRNFAIIGAICFMVGSVACGQDSVDAKIIKLMQAQGAVRDFQEMAARLVASQREAHKSIDTAYWDGLLAQINANGGEELVQKLLPIYKEHFTEAELDFLIEFYTSDIGMAIQQKSTIVQEQVGAAGAAWGEQVGTQVYAKIVETDRLNYQKETQGCAELHEGEYLQVYSDGAEIFLYREGDMQTERYKSELYYYKIEWLNECRYQLTQVDVDKKPVPNGQNLIYNIYQMVPGGHKVITHVPDTEYYDKSTLYTVQTK